jgi:hypothetical protein
MELQKLKRILNEARQKCSVKGVVLPTTAGRPIEEGAAAIMAVFDEHDALPALLASDRQELTWLIELIILKST